MEAQEQELCLANQYIKPEDKDNMQTCQSLRITTAYFVIFKLWNFTTFRDPVQIQINQGQVQAPLCHIHKLASVVQFIILIISENVSNGMAISVP